MKNKLLKPILALALFVGALPTLFAQGTAFTYQGRLNDGGGAASGIYDLRFAIYDLGSAGTQQGNLITNSAAAVSNGFFTVTLDFGNQFPGASRWLEIAVRTNGASAFTALAPRQALTATPYAITALTASNSAVAGSVANGGVNSIALANLSVTTAKLADGSVTTPKLADASVTSAKIAPGAIGSAQLGNGAVTGAQLAAGAAAGNLAAGNQTAVPSGGVIMSVSGPQTQNLLNAGYVKIGTVSLSQESWTNLNYLVGTGELISPRSGHTAVWTGSEMIIWGGNDGTLHNDGFKFNPSANTWTTINPGSGLSPRFGHAAVWTGSRMLVWGGTVGIDLFGDYTVANDGASYNPTTDAWTSMSMAGAPIGRNRATAVWSGSKMIVWGGYTNYVDSQFNALLDVPTGGRYDPAANTWTTVATSGAPTNSIGHTALWTGTEMLVYGGDAANFSGGRYNVTNNTWTAISSVNSPGPRQNHTAVWAGTNMIVWGGFSGSDDTNSGARYNPANNTWTAMTLAGAPSLRELHSAIWTGTKMIVWGGARYSTLYSDLADGFAYDPATNGWVQIPTNSAVAARNSHTAIWTGSAMILWGGQATGYYPEPGGQFFPAFNLWGTLPYAPRTGDPGPRQGAAGVWTGNEMLIFGGENSGFVLGTGFSYNPVSNVGKLLSSTNAPSARQYHTAVWTGKEMIVWGGGDVGSSTSTGARYNPATDSWKTISLTNVPAFRANHVAVWDGTEMLVWGGWQTTLLGSASTGGRYNPITDTWLAMNTTNQPASASSLAAVWTGTEMLVWGGQQISLGGTNFIRTGGRYNPATDSWVQMSSSNAPSVRAGHTAVWSGTECIVFGGFNATTNLNTGARYNPLTDVWTTLSSTNAPLCLLQHTAVWTGTQMIVFGGSYGNGSDGYGNVYDPAFDIWSYTLPRQDGYIAGNFISSANVANHNAFWTSSGMLVFGGRHQSPGTPVYSNLISLYTPQRTMDLLLRP